MNKKLNNHKDTRSQERKIRIAIVGDGLASAICLNKLVNTSGSSALGIDVYAQRTGIGRGMAYSTETPDSMLLNHMVRSMRYSDSDGAGFLSYLREHFNACTTPDDFVPRRIFGDYVESSVAKLFNDNANLSLSIIPVTAIKPGKKKILVQTAHGGKVYDDVIICVGGGGKADTLATKYNNQQTSVSGKNIGIIGASLSAIDMVNHFFQSDSNSWPEKITMTQRTPGFRMVRPINTPIYKPYILTQEFVESRPNFSCKELMELIQKEINCHGISYDFFSYGGLTKSDNFTKDLGKTLLRLCSDPKNLENQPEFAVFGVMNAIIMPLMSIFEQERISPAEAEIFRQKAEKIIFAFLAPMPPHVAGKLVDLIDKGRLQIECGLNKGNETQWRSHFDLCFDMRGINTVLQDYNQLPDLLSDVVGPGKPGKTSRMGGIAYDTKTSRVKSFVKRDINMPYIVGKLKKGQQFDTSESQVIYMDCQKVVRNIQQRHKL